MENPITLITRVYQIDSKFREPGTEDWINCEPVKIEARNAEDASLIFEEAAAEWQNPGDRIITQVTLTADETVQDKYKAVKNTLATLLDNAHMNPETMAEDALDAFSDYNWQPAQGIDIEEYNHLQAVGEAEVMNKEQLDRFFGLVAETDDLPAYYWVRKGWELISK